MSNTLCSNTTLHSIPSLFSHSLHHHPRSSLSHHYYYHYSSKGNNDQFSIAIDFILYLKVKTSNSRFHNWFFVHCAFEMCTMCVIFFLFGAKFFDNWNYFENSKVVSFFVDYCLSSNVGRSFKNCFQHETLIHFLKIRNC